MKDEYAQQIVRALVGIGAELTEIRKQLEALNGAPRDTESEQTFECRCGATLSSEVTARRHAIDEHNSPADTWQEMFS